MARERGWSSRLQPIAWPQTCGRCRSSVQRWPTAPSGSGPSAWGPCRKLGLLRQLLPSPAAANCSLNCISSHALPQPFYSFPERGEYELMVCPSSAAWLPLNRAQELALAPASSDRPRSRGRRLRAGRKAVWLTGSLTRSWDPAVAPVSRRGRWGKGGGTRAQRHCPRAAAPCLGPGVLLSFAPQHGWIQLCSPQSSSLCPPAPLRPQGLEVGVGVLGTKPAQRKAELLRASRVPLTP